MLLIAIENSEKSVILLLKFLIKCNIFLDFKLRLHSVFKVSGLEINKAKAEIERSYLIFG